MFAKYLELSASALFLTTLSLYLLDWFTKNNSKKLFVYSIMLFFIYLYMPIYDNFSVAILLRGLYSDLSVTFICLIMVAYINKVIYYQNMIFLPKKISLLNIILSVMLYLSAFGVIDYDIYSHGYSLNLYMIVGVMCFNIMVYLINKKYAWILLISTAAYYFEIIPSKNIFDYFIDIPLFIISVISLFKKTY